MKVDCLAIAAHRDDLEITSGGLIAKLDDLGFTVAMLDLTKGEMGTKGDSSSREEEATNAAKVLGVKIRDNLELPDAYLEFNLVNRSLLAQKIRDYQPELVILPHWEQRHPDHRICSQLGFDACYYAGLQKADLSGEPHRPRKILYGIYYPPVEPTFVIDISEQYERKIESIKCYKTQFDDGKLMNKIFIPDVNIFEYVRNRDFQMGVRMRVRYAEGYVQKEIMTVDNPLKMAGFSL